MMRSKLCGGNVTPSTHHQSCLPTTRDVFWLIYASGFFQNLKQDLYLGGKQTEKVWTAAKMQLIKRVNE